MTLCAADTAAAAAADTTVAAATATAAASLAEALQGDAFRQQVVHAESRQRVLLGLRYVGQAGGHQSVKINQTVDLSINQSIDLPTNQTVDQSISQSVITEHDSTSSFAR